MSADELSQLERELAYSAARSDIETHCMRKAESLEDPEDWYDIDMIFDPEDQAWVNRAVRYLELRGLIRRHATVRYWVQILDDVKPQ